FFGHFWTSWLSRIPFGHVVKPWVVSFVPAGVKKVTPISGKADPAYSVPVILISVSRAEPAPRMLPVPGQVGPPFELGFFGIGTALTLSVTLGAAPAVADRP